MFMSSIFLSPSGRLFHILGPSALNDLLLTKTVLNLLTGSLLLVVDLRGLLCDLKIIVLR